MLLACDAEIGEEKQDMVDLARTGRKRLYWSEHRGDHGSRPETSAA
jgi:hypothetical protein